MAICDDRELPNQFRKFGQDDKMFLGPADISIFKDWAS